MLLRLHNNQMQFKQHKQVQMGISLRKTIGAFVSSFNFIRL